MRILFIGHNGYGYPHTRVRCYHFAKILHTYPSIETAVLSFRDDLAPHKSEAAMYESLRDREKLGLTCKAIVRLLRERNTVLYIQKAHFHAAAPYLLHRLGYMPEYIFDYDDYDIPLSNFFFRGSLNRLFFGSNKWDEITYRLIRHARGCVAASHFLLDFMKEYNPTQAHIPTGVDTELFFPNPHKNNSRVVFVWNGLVWGEPIVNNVLLMLRSFACVHDQLPAYTLLMIGGGAYWNAMKEQAAKEFSRLPIEWKEWVAPDTMPSLLRNADVGLLPTAGDDEWLRSKSPTKLYEYMASGLPVVATRIGEAVYVQQHEKTGFLVDDEAQFAEGILQLAQRASLRKEMGQAAKDRVDQQFALPVLGEKLHGFLTGLFK
jgi:glycosyltransferase involved in cell wall biosynthesis